MSEESGQADPKHITGDYYWHDTTADWVWIVGGILAITVPPLGAFILGYAVFDSITTDPDG